MCILITAAIWMPQLKRKTVRRALDVNVVWKILISVAVCALAAAHVFLPGFEVDVILLMLLVLAALPWYGKFIKAFEIPGVVKIDLAETKAATEKVASSNILAGSAELSLRAHKATVQGVRAKPDSLKYLRQVFSSDPNLALVGFRIEIEKRVRALAELAGVDSGRGLQTTIRTLASSEVIPSAAASGLIELVALGNRAAHGVEVTRRAAEWVLDAGPSILAELDELISSAGTPNKR
jgi:hypothetical protein